MAKDAKGHGSEPKERRSRTAMVHDVFSSYPTKEPKEVRISPSKARAAGERGVQFYAPGWRPMVFREMAHAESKMQKHPGFSHWKDEEPAVRSTTKNRKY